VQVDHAAGGAAVGDEVQHTAGQPLDVSPHVAHLVGRERGTDQAPQPGVIGRVAELHRLAGDDAGGPVPPAGHDAIAPPGAPGAESRVADDRGTVLVPGHEDGAGWSGVNRRQSAQSRVQRIGIGDGFR
jgi:hypothetical protein